MTNLKTCGKCKVTKPFEEYNKKRDRKDGYQTWCKECNRSRSRQYYAEHTDDHRQETLRRGKIRKQEIKSWFQEYKSNLQCVECGESRHPTFDFHHLDPSTKEGTISEMVGMGVCKERIISEINKCIVLCANCHRMLHYNMDRQH